MKLTNNFSKHEFDCKDGSSMPEGVFVNVSELAKNLQVLRDFIGFPIYINSAYRSPSHNKKVGGSPNSQHLLGKAADIQMPSHRPEQVKKFIEKLIQDGKMKEGGIGIYDWGVHYDIRGHKARWDYRKSLV